MIVMRFKAITAFTLLSAVVAGAEQKGEWTIGPAASADKVRFSIHYSTGPGHDSNNSSDWAKSELPGVSFSNETRHDVQFAIERDAGKIDCHGFMEGANGAGLFHFTPHEQYIRN